MLAESTVTARKIRNLGLSVFNPDNSSDDDAVPIQRNKPQTTAQLLPKPLPVPGVAQGSYFPQQAPLQQLRSPYTARPVQRQRPHPIHSASSSTITGRRMRNLGLRVFDPDNRSDDEPLPIQRNTPQTTAQLLRRPLPTVPGVAQGSYFPQQAPLQQLQSPSHPIHSASSSTSSISISTSLSLLAFQFPIGARQAGAQSSPDNDADEEEMGTMMPGTARVSYSQAAIPAVITARGKPISLRNAHAKSIQRGAPPESNVGEDAQLNGAEEEEEYYFDSDSSEDDERFWTASSAPSATATPPAIKTSGPDDDGSSTLANLTLKPSTAATNLPTSRENSPSPSPSPPSGLTPTSGINRRASFRRDTWAFHPIQEDVRDHLQDFFPDHDLDKPFIDQVQISNDGLPSPGGDYLPAPVPAPVSKEAKFKHRKSIRFVAEERKKVLERVGSAREPSAKAANLGRKKSTKLWGSKVEEVTPGQVKRGVPPTIPESPTGPAPRPTIKWVKGELIGRGTYGKVFLAFNVTTGEMMAVKQVEMPQTISDQDDVRQVNIVKALESEQQTLEKLDHPNIVQYLGFEKTKEFFSVFLEYVPGGSIGSCLRRQGKFDENIIKSFTGQIIDGLAYLHANKIIHRDIKADNVLVDPSGNCKISDFGISKQSEEIYNNAAMTAMQGSLFWMAPEMLHNDKKGYNAKIDIWSLGCVFIEMFAGRRPWEQDDFVSVMFKVGRNKMAPPVPSDVHLSEEADDFRLKCFAQDPDERPTAEGLKGHPWLDLPPGWIFSGFH